jgi:hypothetical protein
MNYRSSLLPVMLMSIVGLVAMGLLATGGANKAAADPDGGDRLGCGTYCQNAGGFGGAGNTVPAQVLQVASSPVRVSSDGYVPVTVTCVASSTCQGFIVLAIANVNSRQVCGGGKYHWAGCSDLVVNANSTRTISVPLTPDAFAYVRANSPVSVHVTASSGVSAPSSDMSQSDLQASAM